MSDNKHVTAIRNETRALLTILADRWSRDSKDRIRLQLDAIDRHVNALATQLAEAEARVDAYERRPFSSDAGVRGKVVRELAAWARQAPIPDSEGGWDIRYDVSDWLMRHLDELEGAP